MLEQLSKAEVKFVDQHTRKLLVGWADHQVRHREAAQTVTQFVVPTVYLEYAQKKGWVSKKNNLVLAVGFSTAAAFLRR